MDINSIFSTFFTAIILLFFVSGVIYSLNQKKKMIELLKEESLIASFTNVEIRNVESIKRSFWIGTVKLFQNYILIQNNMNYDLIQLDENIKNDIKFKILYHFSSIENKTIHISGTKKRLFEKSAIHLKIKFDRESDSKMIYSFLNQR